MAFPWLPIGAALGDGITSGRVLRESGGWQVLSTSEPDSAALVLNPRMQGAPSWWPEEVAAACEELSFSEVSDGSEKFPCLLTDIAAAPHNLAELALRNPAVSAADLRALLEAIRSLRGRRPAAGWDSALFIAEPSYLIGTREDAAEDRLSTMVAVLSGGARDRMLTPGRIRELNPWLTEREIVQALSDLGLRSAVPRRARPVDPPERFLLPGQPELERIFRERIVDVAHRSGDYARMGVGLPGGVLLSGPPGSGKSFAAGRLADFLGWPLFDLSIAGVGSSFLHETARRIAEIFSKAADAAPSIVLLEELDALGTARDRTHSAGVEEVNTLLREMEQAANRSLLVIGTTNRPDALDPALLRRGRFDIKIALAAVTVEQAQAMLDSLLDERPHVPGLSTAAVAGRLAGRPASDAAWVVEEAARIAVQQRKDAIDDLCLAAAVRGLT